jgi:poly-gamma-glutamate synthesis protein (capsule biosynthesis protein)
MAFTGDTLPHSPLWAQAARNAAGNGFDFRPMLAPLRSLLVPVDLAVCHLETPIAPAGEAYSTYPLYGVPAEIAGAIAAAGYDRCSTASNHTLDRGVAGIDRTVNVLHRAGVDQSGMARTPDEIAPRVFTVNGVRISHLSYTFSFNGLVLPSGQEWRSALIDPARIVADARRAKRLGAQAVIVSLHWGNEGIAEPTAMQVDVAERITSSGLVDLVVGHHAHVLQRIDRVHGTWVLYGLGNILSNLPTSARWPASSQDGAVVTTRLSLTKSGELKVARPVVHPTWVDRDAGWIVRPVVRSLTRRDLRPGLRAQLTESLRRTGQVLRPYIDYDGLSGSTPFS